MDVTKHGFTFLHQDGPLAVAINQKANILFSMLQNFDARPLDIQEGLKDYFIHHHLGSRLFFSIQNSAHIIYNAVTKTGKKISQLNMADYGAGLGTLYMLGGMMGFKRMVYNDYLPDWKNTAQSICTALHIHVDDYVTGDIDAILNYAANNNFVFDIIASRNVIEHIYDLPFFFKEVYKHNPNAVIFSTTSANYHNPAMRLKHYLLHKKIDKTQYQPIRKKAIEKEWPAVNVPDAKKLLKLTRGKALADFTRAIDDYRHGRRIAPVAYLRTNTCLPGTGLWCEHLLTKNEYKTIINNAGYQLDYSAGYWDTHYASALMNTLAKALNKAITVMGKKGFLLSPFVNIVAYN